ncbi:hypothetical protein KY320_02180 [Candidatus Woesearchaeota archaeon]|nr:hypothetical protein [Candidatus Woesearchaeota archaeon]
MKTLPHKAQVKMFETVAVLVVFFFLFGFGMVFYMGAQKSSFEASQSDSFEMQAIDVLQIVSSLPELQCSTDNIVKENCFELQKIIAFKSVTATPQARSYYYNLLRYSNIEVNKIYPDNTWIGFSNPLYDNKPADFTQASKSLIPISVYDAKTREYYAAVLEVTVYRSVNS